MFGRNAKSRSRYGYKYCVYFVIIEQGIRAKRGFFATIKNYDTDACVLWVQQAFAVVSAFPYSRSFHRLLLYDLICVFN